MLTRPVGRPPNHVRRFHASFTYQAGSWTKPRRVVAKVKWHPGELVPRVGFIVTNLSRPAERVVAFYNQRGTCEQWIKEGKGAIKWTRLPCRTFAANAVRLQLPAHAGDAGADQRLVADQPEGEADQGRRQARQPRPLCRFPDGRGRRLTPSVRRDPAVDRRTAAAATSSAGVSGPVVMPTSENHGRGAPWRGQYRSFRHAPCRFCRSRGHPAAHGEAPACQCPLLASILPRRAGHPTDVGQHY